MANSFPALRRNKMKNNRKYTEKELYAEFYGSVQDILFHPAVLEMKRYQQHCQTSCYQHCLSVAYYNFCICKFFDLDAVSAARGGMLHDLFLYDWHHHSKRTGDHFHAMTHPWTAYHNANKFFDINPIEKEVITKHMWPVTFIPPRYLETYVICLTDKYCGTLEIAKYYSGIWNVNKLGRQFAGLIHKMYSKAPNSQELVPDLGALENAAISASLTHASR